VTPPETQYGSNAVRDALREAKRLIAAHVPDAEPTVAYVERSEDRIVYTVQRVLAEPRVREAACEIGFGAIGLTYHLVSGRPIAAFDLVDRYRGLCGAMGIPFQQMDLRDAGALGTGRFDLVLLFEVIEHIDRPPAWILTELRKSLLPGGKLMLSTVNLTRLLNRLRLLAGRPLFADYEPGELVEAHFREYMREELERYARAAGFAAIRSDYYCQPDFRRGMLFVAAYRAACRLRARFSNVIFLDAEVGASDRC
jgi:SAM-dependent methyltransferase